jgi:hypothetical protein
VLRHPFLLWNHYTLRPRGAKNTASFSRLRRDFRIVKPSVRACSESTAARKRVTMSPVLTADCAIQRRFLAALQPGFRPSATAERKLLPPPTRSCLGCRGGRGRHCSTRSRLQLSSEVEAPSARERDADGNASPGTVRQKPRRRPPGAGNGAAAPRQWMGCPGSTFATSLARSQTPAMTS